MWKKKGPSGSSSVPDGLFLAVPEPIPDFKGTTAQTLAVQVCGMCQVVSPQLTRVIIRQNKSDFIRLIPVCEITTIFNDDPIRLCGGDANR